MKSIIKIYLKFLLFILISFIIISLIMATIISFIHLPNSFYHFIINILASIIMIIWAFWIIKVFKDKAIIHSLIASLLFSIISFMINIDNISIINIISRPLALLLSTVVLFLYQKKLEA